jgi:hypothetical protein
MVKPKSMEAGRWKVNEKSKPPSCPKATFDILLDKYQEGRAGVMKHKNWALRLDKPEHPVSLS